MRNNLFKLTYCLLAGISIVLIGCSHHATQKRVITIPQELIGHWASEDGCILNFIKENDKLILVNFSDLHDNKFGHVSLSCVKNGIMTQFSSLPPNVRFDGTFVEGELIVNNYCKKPLHKINN